MVYPNAFAVRSNTSIEPTSTGVQSLRTFEDAIALSVISGPIPLKSPIVMPITGFLFIRQKCTNEPSQFQKKDIIALYRTGALHILSSVRLCLFCQILNLTIINIFRILYLTKV